MSQQCKELYTKERILDQAVARQIYQQQFLLAL